MPGTLTGGRKAAKTNFRKYGDDYYKVIGAKGGSRSSSTKGFGNDRVRARANGAKGGSRSKRGYKLLRETDKYLIYFNYKTGINNRVPKDSL